MVDQRVLQCGVEERREMRAPHHRGEDDPRDQRVRGDADDPRVQDRQERATTHPRRGDAEHERDRCREREERCCDRGQQEMLDHVHAEERLGIHVGRALQGEGKCGQAGDPGSRAPPWHRGVGMVPVHGSDRGEVRDGEAPQDEREERVDRPGGEGGQRVERRERVTRAVGRDRGRAAKE